MIDLHPLGELQLDALREAANIGVGIAATTPSAPTGQRVVVHVPRSHVVGDVSVEGFLVLAPEPASVDAAPHAPGPDGSWTR